MPPAAPAVLPLRPGSTLRAVIAPASCHSHAHAHAHAHSYSHRHAPRPHARPLPAPTSSRRAFSSTPAAALRTKQREALYRWLGGEGAVFRDALPGSTNYLTAYQHGQLRRTKSQRNDADQDEPQPGHLPPETPMDLRPFPQNPWFTSQAVLSEELKQRIFDAVVTGACTVREASEKFHVDTRRVGAVVRLKTIEQQWVKEGKPLATPYARAVLAMVPQTPADGPRSVHESINDLPVHKATMAQLFWPASESRQFTRRDAGAAFQRGLLPAEERIPHPEMVRAAARHSDDLPAERTARAALLTEEWRERDAEAEERSRIPERRRAEHTTTVHAPRADFRFEDVRVTRRSVGKYVTGIGVRYGVPIQDRKKGNVKIPRKVR